MPCRVRVRVQNAAWTKLETDHLVQLSLKYDLRWPVIKDRFKCTPDRPVQDLQERFYDVANRLQVPTGCIAHLACGVWVSIV